MTCIPPHKRHSKYNRRPSRTPELRVRPFNRHGTHKQLVNDRWRASQTPTLLVQRLKIANMQHSDNRWRPLQTQESFASQIQRHQMGQTLMLPWGYPALHPQTFMLYPSQPPQPRAVFPNSLYLSPTISHEACFWSNYPPSPHARNPNLSKFGIDQCGFGSFSMRSFEANIDRIANKQHSDTRWWPSQTAGLLVPQFETNRNPKSFTSCIDRSGTIMYAGHAISRWLAVGLDVNGQLPSYIHLEPVSEGISEGKLRKMPHILVNSYLCEENGERKGISLRSPWAIVAENVLQDILSSFENLRDDVEYQGLEKVKPTMVARFGKMLFHRHPSVSLNSFVKNQVSENILKQLQRTIHANLPLSYMENIKHAVVPKVGFNNKRNKDRYLVKLSDNTRPAETVSCKCEVTEDKKLLLKKVELSQVRHMVTDVSFLDKNVDMRLMLRTKTILTSTAGDEMNSIRDLINSAVLDSDVKGGLRWPQGMTSSEDRYCVIEVWHTIAETYTIPSVRLKMRHADRFNFKSDTGEAAREIYLKLTGAVSELQKKGAESHDSVTKMLEDSFRLIWDHFLSCEPFPK